MSAVPGWYPDPGGQPGMVRYWDGRTWSAEIRPVGSVGGPGAGPTGPSGPMRSGQGPGGAGPLGAGQAGLGPQASGQPLLPPRRRSPVGWILGGLAILVVLAVVAFLVIRSLGAGPIAGPGPDPKPSQAASQPISCPDAVQPTAEPPATNDGRVHSGKLSYPTLPAPFDPPEWDQRAPFGRDVLTQNAPVEVSSDGTTTWVAGVLIARLLAGDGFFGPQQGAQIVATCIVGRFYGNAEVHREDRKNQASKVDGHDAWLVEMHLTFDIPGIKTKGELATVVVVDTGQGEAGLFFASVPDTAPQFLAPAEQSLRDLKVDA